MWSRAELKQRAKTVLKTSYWKAFLVSLILAIVGGGVSGTTNLNINGDAGEMPSDLGTTLSDPGIFTWILAAVIAVGLIVFVIALAFQIFLINPLEAGGCRYFKVAAEKEANLDSIGYAFDRNRYMDITKAMFWRGLLNFLWFLLLIIPGIVKSYAYRMVPFILADNPNIGYKRAVELSNRMTRGHKFRMFVLDLSFIGWFLLGTLALFVGVLFVLPYYNSVQAELYLVLRHRALNERITSEEELRLGPPAAPEQSLFF